ncbi:hypothetical protein BU26DRAFT_501847 [Trematosphaeria pertusa]|uniref:Uncharacterized protein n=1 Tax=Trematosphaeria pertusa TaxID=390896 RepID=A0A6A6IT87_9PLEO|nr:uncharacterized protein BU26DRAFT_501847 [Trematosphaeria pertusa]KAF2253704.1 hypothetical protein BU26DRAFT_501847 [Trematosphaeria pertusa]
MRTLRCTFALLDRRVPDLSFEDRRLDGLALRNALHQQHAINVNSNVARVRFYGSCERCGAIYSARIGRVCSEPASKLRYTCPRYGGGSGRSVRYTACVGAGIKRRARFVRDTLAHDTAAEASRGSGSKQSVRCTAGVGAGIKRRARFVCGTASPKVGLTRRFLPALDRDAEYPTATTTPQRAIGRTGKAYIGFTSRCSTVTATLTP